MTSLLVDQTPLLAFLQEQVILPLIKRKAFSAGEELRIWSIGCAAGDEANTLALLVQSQLLANSIEKALALFATDADPVAITHARDYHYPALLLSSLPENAHPYLEADPEEYRLQPSLRKKILFASHALLSQMPFPNLDLILCHDSWTNFTPDQQMILFNRLAYALTPGGNLVLTSPIASKPEATYFQKGQEMGACSIYQRTPIPAPITSLGWVKEEHKSSLIQDNICDQDEVLNVYLEELQTTLEDREMAFEEINQRYQASKQAYQELAQVQQLKDDFLSMMSHEMRTPLTILLLTAQSLLRKLEHSQEEGPVAFHERVKESLVTIQQQGQQLQVLLADLLDAARLQGDMFRLSLCSMDLVKLVQESIIQQELLTTRRVKLICALETMVGIWDKTRLKQVIHNLLTNALKYSEASTEVVITLRYHFISKHAQEILISVQDHGRGIDKEDLPHIFKQFYRAKKQPDADYQANVSLGLGLSICAEIMKRHGGRIWVESCSGEGSTFFAILPLREPAKGSLSS